jgi:hypothetical protein
MYKLVELQHVLWNKRVVLVMSRRFEKARYTLCNSGRTQSKPRDQTFENDRRCADDLVNVKVKIKRVIMNHTPRPQPGYHIMHRPCVFEAATLYRHAQSTLNHEM